ncbi:MAG TPA: hypothetical protein VII70_10025 [Steroidobacteraceae bacterium]
MAGRQVDDLTVVLNDYVSDLWRLTRFSYWPLAERLKLAVSTSARFIERFEDAAITHARARGYDGIVCGHIHRANLRRAGGVVYCNTGVWVESCLALIEDANGELRLWRLGRARREHSKLARALLADPA